jgi:hypothetical protein
MPDLEYVPVRADVLEEMRLYLLNIFEELEAYEHVVFWCNEDHEQAFKEHLEPILKDLRNKFAEAEK